MEAIKTEYKGIVFDSKSEAVFARTLDLASIYWRYHPGSYCGHAWDFCVVRYEYEVIGLDFEEDAFFYDSEGNAIPYGNDPLLYGYQRPILTLIEFKPALPTRTYVDNLIASMRKKPSESILVWGSPWKGVKHGRCSYSAYPIFTKWGKYGWGDYVPELDKGGYCGYSSWHDIASILGITEEVVQEARRYRFDLQS